MEERGLTQAQVADAAGVSQSTVSRVLRRSPQRSGSSYLRLCSWIRKQTVSDGSVPAPLLAAVRATWDGSAGHAAALAALIEVSGQLWPALGDSEE